MQICEVWVKKEGKDVWQKRYLMLSEDRCAYVTLEMTWDHAW